MGRFLTCAYLRPRDASGGPLTERLTAKLLREGFEPVEEPADRWLALLSTQGSPWVFLLDSDNAMEDTGVSELRKEARKLAKAAGSDVLYATVVDSDAFAVTFCGEGAADVVVRDPGGGYGNLGCGPRTGKGKPALWQAFFGLSDEQTQALRELWQGEFVFAEAQLADMFTLLGLDAAGLDLFPDELEASEVPEGCTLEVLHFRAKEKPFEIVTEGETMIDLGARQTYLEPGRAACDSFYNIGGITTGAAFLLIGEFFRDFRGTFSEVTIEKSVNCKKVLLSDMTTQAARFEPITLPDGQYAMIARFPDFEFPEGVKVNEEAVTSWTAVHNAQRDRSMIVRYTMRTCPHEIPEDTVITAALLPKHGRALQAIPLKLRPEGTMERWAQARRQEFSQMLRASMLAELAGSKDKQSRKYQMTQAMFDLYEKHGWERDDAEVRAEKDRIMKEFIDVWMSK